MNLVKSKQRVAVHGEVFTPPRMVEAMPTYLRMNVRELAARTGR